MWHDYGKCLQAKTFDGVADRSRADALFIWLSLKIGHSPEEIAEKLLEVSTRAQESRQKYVERTISEAVRYFNNNTLQPMA